jgi:hypothetical protein
MSDDSAEIQKMKDRIADLVLEDARKETREMMKDPEFSRLGRDGCFALALREQFRKNPQVGQYWKDAPGVEGRKS